MDRADWDLMQIKKQPWLGEGRRPEPGLVTASLDIDLFVLQQLLEDIGVIGDAFEQESSAILAIRRTCPGLALKGNQGGYAHDRHLRRVCKQRQWLYRKHRGSAPEIPLYRRAVVQVY